MLWMSYYSRSILFGFVFLFSCTSKSNCFLTHHVKIQILQSESLPQQSTLLRSLGGEDGGATSPQQTNDLKSASSLPIKCPNCDLCDGSGRYVHIYSVDIMNAQVPSLKVVQCSMLLLSYLPYIFSHA
jgi:hypothetical protein